MGFVMNNRKIMFAMLMGLLSPAGLCAMETDRLLSDFQKYLHGEPVQLAAARELLQSYFCYFPQEQRESMTSELLANYLAIRNYGKIEETLSWAGENQIFTDDHVVVWYQKMEEARVSSGSSSSSSSAVRPVEESRASSCLHLLDAPVTSIVDIAWGIDSKTHMPVLNEELFKRYVQCELVDSVCAYLATALGRRVSEKFVEDFTRLSDTFGSVAKLHELYPSYVTRVQKICTRVAADVQILLNQATRFLELKDADGAYSPLFHAQAIVFGTKELLGDLAKDVYGDMYHKFCAVRFAYAPVRNALDRARCVKTRSVETRSVEKEASVGSAEPKAVAASSSKAAEISLSEKRKTESKAIDQMLCREAETRTLRDWLVKAEKASTQGKLEMAMSLCCRIVEYAKGRNLTGCDECLQAQKNIETIKIRIARLKRFEDLKKR